MLDLPVLRKVVNRHINVWIHLKQKEENSMKKAFTDVKSFVTILFALAVVILLFIAVFKSETVFETVFLLFTNLCTAVFTYFFTKKNTDNIINDSIEK